MDTKNRATFSDVIAEIQKERLTYPGWRDKGEADPHDKHYDASIQRADLALGYLSDDQLAVGAFMNYDQKLDVHRVMAKDPDYHSPIAWMTAVKERIRWLSRRLWDAEKRIEMMQASGIPVPAIEDVPQHNDLKSQNEALKLQIKLLEGSNNDLIKKLQDKEKEIFMDKEVGLVTDDKDYVENLVGQARENIDVLAANPTQERHELALKLLRDILKYRRKEVKKGNR